MPGVSARSRARWFQRPALLHIRKCRCAVAWEMPNVCGRCRQAQSLVSTNTTAVKTVRALVGAVPPPCGRDENDGSAGATNDQRLSDTKRSDNPASWCSGVLIANPVPRETLPVDVLGRFVAVGHFLCGMVRDDGSGSVGIDSVMPESSADWQLGIVAAPGHPLNAL